MEVEADADHGMRTGNVICVPNAQLLTSPIINETRILNYEWKEVTFELAAGEDWRGAEQVLSDEAQAIVSEYEDELHRELAEMSSRFAFHAIQSAPHVFLKSLPDGGVRVWVRVALPARRIAELADRLNRAFLGWRSAATQL